MKGFSKKAVKTQQNVKDLSTAGAPTTDEDTEISSVVKGFSKLYSDGFETTRPYDANWSRVNELHPSSFPFCGMFKAMDRFKHGDVMKTTDKVMGQEFFTSIGTEVHRVTQDSISQAHREEILKKSSVASDPNILSMRMIGRYECRKCKYKKTFCAYPEHDCRKCGSDFGWEYVELPVYYGKTITGHSDGLLEVTFKDGTIKYYVIDYKTTSVTALMRHKESGNYFPYEGNKRQIKSYCVLFEKKYPVEISGWLLLYIARNSPYSFVGVGEEITKDEKTKLSNMLDQYDDDWQKIFEFNEDTEDSEGTTIKLDELFEDLYESKPCKDFLGYKSEMMDTYFSCPHAITGECFDKKDLKARFDSYTTSGNLIKMSKVR